MFSKIIQNNTASPKFKVDELPEAQYHIDVSLDKLEANLHICFNTVNNNQGELSLSNLVYKTAYGGDHLGVIDGLIQMIQGIPAKRVDRIGVKELDHFLRDSAASPAVPAYTPLIFDILGLGESIKGVVFPKEVKATVPLLDPKQSGDFNMFSYAEQIEIIEEVFALRIYGSNLFREYEFEVEDISVKEIKLNFSIELTKEQREYIQKQLCYELSLSDYKIIFLLLR